MLSVTAIGHFDSLESTGKTLIECYLASVMLVKHEMKAITVGIPVELFCFVVPVDSGEGIKSIVGPVWYWVVNPAPSLCGSYVLSSSVGCKKH